MRLETIIFDTLQDFCGKDVIIVGTDKYTESAMEYIKKNNYNINILYYIDFCKKEHFWGKNVYTIAESICNGFLKDRTLIILHAEALLALKSLQKCDCKEIYVCSGSLYKSFHGEECFLDSTFTKEVFPMEVSYKANEPVAFEAFDLIMTNAYSDGRINTLELLDFQKLEHVLYKVNVPTIPVDLAKFSENVNIDTLPMGMNHLSYLMWKQSVHVVQLSPNKKYIIAPRYNFFYLDILELETGKYIKWHDLPKEEGLWDYVATGDFDIAENAFYFCRWPLEDAIKGMNDGTNSVRMQVGKLFLDTLKAEIIHEFTFKDRVHQCTISGDGRYMVFAPMRVLLPKENPHTIAEKELMKKIQSWAILDNMATLDVQTKTVTETTIPYPIPAHFELDPFDPHLVYVSTHSLLPHAEGVLCFQPATIHKLRIIDGVATIEATYTHKNFVRSIQHCVFVYENEVYIAATNQNKMEIIRASDMSLWHQYKIVDDPLYDDADFSKADFLEKPFKLPAAAAHCDSISASVDGKKLVLRMAKEFLVYDVKEKRCTAKIIRLPLGANSSHARFYMQNSPYEDWKKHYTIR